MNETYFVSAWINCSSVTCVSYKVNSFRRGSNRQQVGFSKAFEYAIICVSEYAHVCVINTRNLSVAIMHNTHIMIYFS